MARPRAADDFKTIRARMEELRRERDRALEGQNLGSPVYGTRTGRQDHKDERRLPRSVLLLKLVR